MKKGFIEVICGDGKGKTSLALGQSLRACAKQKSVIIIQFLKGKEKGELSWLAGTELDIKFFRFEKSEKYFEALSQQQKEEQRENIRNGLNYARKVIATHECDVLLLDEILGLPQHGIATCEEINEILKINKSDMQIILTGRRLPEEMREYVDAVTTVDTEYLSEICVDKESE